MLSTLFKNNSGVNSTYPMIWRRNLYHLLRLLGVCRPKYLIHLLSTFVIIMILANVEVVHFDFFDEQHP